MQEGWDAVADIVVPTLLIRGQNSNLLTPEIAKKFVDLVDDCEFAEIEGSGHSVPLDKPKEFRDEVLRFL